jgi:leucyl-tRNA synthetase
LLVNIRFNATLGELIEVFKNLNKSQAVPDLYIRDQVKQKRDTIDTIANEWIVKYKKHFSSSANPISGNTNRNKFVELLDKLYDKHKIDETNIDTFRKILDDANRHISTIIPSKASIDVRLKCKETGCYLFLYKNDKLEEII